MKAYIETILIAKANSVSINIQQNPSPSKDARFTIPENLQSVEKGISEMANGEGKVFTISEIKNKLGV